MVSYDGLVFRDVDIELGLESRLEAFFQRLGLGLGHQATRARMRTQLAKTAFSIGGLGLGIQTPVLTRVLFSRTRTCLNPDTKDSNSDSELDKEDSIPAVTLTFLV